MIVKESEKNYLAENENQKRVEYRKNNKIWEKTPDYNYKKLF